MNPSAPSIKIPVGWEIGYQRKGLLAKGRPQALLSTEKEITMTPGIHLLAARNGRGKSTMLRTLAGLQNSLSGNATSCGRAQYVGEGLRYDVELNVEKICWSMLDKTRRQFAMHLASELELEIHKPYGQLSKGNQQKVHIVVAESMAHGFDAGILLLDEPISNLDYHVRMRLNDYWMSSSQRLLRIICLHELEWAPEWASLLLISGGRLSQVMPGAMDLERLYHQLN